jgi:hypothetical protein
LNGTDHRFVSRPNQGKFLTNSLSDPNWKIPGKVGPTNSSSFLHACPVLSTISQLSAPSSVVWKKEERRAKSQDKTLQSFPFPYPLIIIMIIII